MTEIPTYDQWMSDTAGSFYERRNDFLRALDQAIKDYHSRGKNKTDLDIVRKTLYAYVTNHEQRKRADSWKHSIRNKRGAVERLMLAVMDGPTPRIPDPPQEPEPRPLPPPPPRVVSCPQAKKLLDELSLQFKYMKETPQEAILGPHETRLYTAITSLSTDLGKLYCDVTAALERTRNNFLNSIQAGLETFVGLHTADAEDTSFKLNIASKVFSAMESLPFPLSVIGKAGGAITGLAKVETIGPHLNKLTVRMPQPEGITKAISDAAETFNQWRTVNVAPSKIGGLGNVRSQFVIHFQKFESSLKDAWKLETDRIGNDQARRALAREMVSTSLSKLRINAEMQTKVNNLEREIRSLGESIASKFKHFTDLNAIDHEQVGLWITISVIADYAISGLCGLEENQAITSLDARTLGGKRFGDKFAEFLASDEVGLLEMKTSERKSSAIYGDGKIPWAGHPAHVVAVLLYLDWMKRTLNPFDLISKTTDISTFKRRSKEYIQQMGKIIQSNYESHWIGHHTVSAAGIAQLAKIA